MFTRRCLPTAALLRFAARIRDRFHHELDVHEQIAPDRLRQRVQVIEQARRNDLILIEIPQRDLLLDHAAEELRLGQSIRSQKALELREFERSNPLAGLERADRLLADAGESRDVLLTQSAHASDFTKFQYEIHAD